MTDQISLYHHAENQVRVEHRLKKLERALEQIRALSNYPGKGRSDFTELVGARRKINKLACDALREEE
jgi:plasmid stabilization system protein ParE